MEEFKIIQPSTLLAPYIKNYWLLKTCNNSPALARTVPTGMMSLIFHRGKRLLSVRTNELHPRAFLSGQEITHTPKDHLDMVNYERVAECALGISELISRL